MSDPYSDKETISNESYSTLEVISDNITLPIQPCELCRTRPGLGNKEYLSCGTRPRFESDLCASCGGDAVYFSVTYFASQSNCLRCARRLSEHTTEQLQGCFLDYKYISAHRSPPRQTIYSLQTQWPAQNTHQRNLTDNPSSYEPATKDPNKNKQGRHRKY